MTVSTQVSRNEYTGNGATTQYDFTFRILDKSHLLVQTLDTSENIVTLTLGTDYTVTGVNRYNGGKVVLTSALPAGYKISIERSTPVTQEASIRNQGGFFPEIHEDAFDKLTMLVQQAYGWWSGLSLRKPSWLANYYDALNNRIRNLRDPSQAQDASTKNYVDSADSGLQQQITSNFNRSLRVPDSYINQLPSAGERAWKGLGFDGAGQTKLQDPAGTGLWGYVPTIGSFEKGSLLTQRFEVLLWESTNEYWRWDGVLPKVVLPFSTPATAGGIGKGKWLDVTDATLRSNLASDDGQKLIGKCGSLDALRSTEPEYHGQEIILFRAVADGPVLNERLYYDATDTTSEENGFSVFVTPNGARWKADVSEGYNVFLAGFSPSENNIAQCIHKINVWIVAQAINASRVNDRKATILIPGLIDSGGATVYTMTEDVHFCAALVELVPLTLQFWDFSSSVDVPILCSNEFEGLRGGMGNSYNGGAADQGGFAINPRSFLYIKGGGEDYTPHGVILGNRSRRPDGTAYLNVRDTVIRNVRVFNCGDGLTFGNYDTYMVGFENCNAYANTRALSQPTATALNAGERWWLNNCVLSNSTEDNIYINSNGPAIYFDNVSNDYARRDAFRFGPNAAGSFLFTNSHFEGYDQMLINQPVKEGSGGQCRFLMIGGLTDPRRTGVTYRGIRDTIYGATYRGVVAEFRDVDMGAGPAGYMCNSKYGSWTGAENPAVVIIQHKNSDTYKWLPGYGYGVGKYALNPVYKFTGAAGASLPTTKATASAASAYHWIFTQGGATAVFGAADTDGLIPVKISMTSATDVLYLYQATEIQFPRNTNYLSAMCAIKCKNAVGEVKVQAVIRPLGNPTITVANSVVTQTENVRSQVLGDEIDVLNTILTKGYIDLTKDDFISTPPLKVPNYFLGSVTSNAGFKIYGFTGEIELELPVYWFDNMHPNT
ncbi:phage tail fiber protein [Klebsiella quasipneumoniae]|uniref:phage tail fiber domain-containing protein n=1 Tax=Klebsiella quasipneumoniae TaxID=1463165 RepID=UPI002FDF12D1